MRATLIVATAALSVACSSTGYQASAGDLGPVANTSMAARAEPIVASWPAMPRDAATKLIAKYGQPNVSGDRMLTWYGKGNYVKISIARDEQPHNFPMAHTDFLSSTVKLSVPADKLDELARYDGSVWYHRTRGELTAQCDKEELNNLALNLANDIVTGKRTVEDARAFYAKTAMEFKQGQLSDYVTGLRFTPNPNSADPDVAHKM
jgi:hypothetical protein